MAKRDIKVGSTSQTVEIFIQDSSSTTGAGLTGLAFNTASLTAYYMLARAAAVSITLATLAAVTSAFSSGGFKEIDATNSPGWYRFDIPDAALASGRSCAIHFKGATNMAPLPLEIQLTGWDNQDAVHGGLSTLPNAAAGAVGGLPLAVDTSGRVDVLKINGTSQTARDIGLSVLLAAGQKVDVDTIKTNPVVNAGTVTFPSGATLASTTNITAGTVTTTTNLTNNNDKTGYAIGAGGLAAAGFATDAIDANALAASAATEIVTAMFARAFSAAYGSLTFDQMIKVIASALFGKCSGMATTTAVFRNPGDTADVITATVDSNGNRTAVTVVP